jgi:hypothetical protein
VELEIRSAEFAPAGDPVFFSQIFLLGFLRLWQR